MSKRKSRSTSRRSRRSRPRWSKRNSTSTRCFSAKPAPTHRDASRDGRRVAPLPSSGGNLSTMPLHMADIGTDTFDQDFTLGMAETERALLDEIDAARSASTTRPTASASSAGSRFRRPDSRPSLGRSIRSKRRNSWSVVTVAGRLSRQHGSCRSDNRFPYSPNDFAPGGREQRTPAVAR